MFVKNMCIAFQCVHFAVFTGDLVELATILFHFITKLKIIEATAQKFVGQMFEKEKCEVTKFFVFPSWSLWNFSVFWRHYPRVVNWFGIWSDFQILKYGKSLNMFCKVSVSFAITPLKQGLQQKLNSPSWSAQQEKVFVAHILKINLFN